MGPSLGAQLMMMAVSREASNHIATREVAMAQEHANKEKAEHFAALGRAGGLKGGPARALSLPPERRSEIARMGAIARRDKLAKEQA